MKNPFDDESSDSFALINAEGQHSLVPPLPSNMNTTLRIDAASGAEAANQAPTIASAITKAEQSTKEAISSLIGSSVRLAPVILEGVAAVLAVLYLLGVCAFAAALLFYTFSR